jgi:hypothetical protein
MNSHFRFFGLRPVAWVLALLVSLSLAADLRAAPARRAKIANDSAEAGLLREAYVSLATADHDYKGHRALAMKEIEAAAKALGVNLHGDGKVREAQAVSDDHLRYAQGLLEQITGALGGAGLKRIEAAIAQLNVALAIR